MRLRAEYRVGPDLKFLANLDMMHLMERTLRRAKIPCLLSEGFNPHIRLSMGTVLPVGLWGEKEYFDLELNPMPVQEFVNAMNKTLPPGMHISLCRELASGEDSLMKIINAADYAFQIKAKGLDLEKLAADIMGQEQIVVQSRGKKKNLQKDLRPGIYAMNVEKSGAAEVLSVRVSVNEPVNIRFDELLDVFARNGIDRNIMLDFWRQGNYIKQGDNFYPPMQGAMK